MSAVLNRGSYMAIMPELTAPASEVLEIAPIMFAGSVYIQLLDGRMFATIGGQSLLSGNARKTYAVPATKEHWAALQLKQPEVQLQS